MGRRQLAERAGLDSADEVEIEMCGGEHNRLGFAYQVVFAKVHSRLPAQHPFEVEDELVAFAALQASLDSGAMDLYREQRRTIQRQQDRIREYRGLARLGANEQAELEAFVFEMASRIDDRASLLLQAREQLREQGVLLPAESTLERTVTEQRQRSAHVTHIAMEAQSLKLVGPGQSASLGRPYRTGLATQLDGRAGSRTFPLAEHTQAR